MSVMAAKIAKLICSSKKTMKYSKNPLCETNASQGGEFFLQQFETGSKPVSQSKPDAESCVFGWKTDW